MMATLALCTLGLGLQSWARPGGWPAGGAARSPHALTCTMAAPHRDGAPGGGADGAGRRPSAAAQSVLQKLSTMRSSKSQPVDMDGLGRLVRSSDALRGEVLYHVLLELKQQRRPELGVALLTMVEATQHADGVGARPWGGLPRPRARHLSGHDDDPDDDDDELFRRMIASSANFAGDRSGDRSDAEWSDEMDAEVLQTGVGEDGPVDSTGPGAYQMGAPRPVDTVHYNLVIAACAAARRWQDSLELLLRMREGGVPRDTVTYNSVIHSLSRGGRWRLALKLFKQMRRDDVPPDTRTFATVISACANAGEWQPSP